MTHQYEVGKWYKTRGGEDALIYDVNFKGHSVYTILGKIKGVSDEERASWKSNGAYWISGCEDPRDLMPPVERK